MDNMHHDKTTMRFPNFVSIDVLYQLFGSCCCQSSQWNPSKAPPTWCAPPIVLGFPPKLHQNSCMIGFVQCYKVCHTFWKISCIFLSQRHPIIFLVYVEGTLPLIMNVGPVLRASTSNWTLAPRTAPFSNLPQHKIYFNISLSLSQQSTTREENSRPIVSFGLRQYLRVTKLTNGTLPNRPKFNRTCY